MTVPGLISAARLPVAVASASGVLRSLLTAAMAVTLVEALTGLTARTLGVVAALLVIRAAAAAMEPPARARAQAIVRRLLQEALYRHIVAVGPAVHDRRRSGDLAALATEATERVGAMVGRFVPLLVRAVVVPVAVGVYLLTVDWWLAVVVLAALPAVAVALRRLEARFRQAGDRLREARDRLAADFLDALQGLTTLNLFRQAGRWAGTLAARSQGVRAETMQVLAVNQRALIWVDLVYALMSVVAVVAIAGWRLSVGAIGAADAVVAVLVAAVAIEPLVDVVSFFYVGALGLAAHRRIRETLAMPAREGVPGPETPARGEVVFEDVAYVHPGTDAPALIGVWLTVPAGARVALVGRSGAGKSTVASLALGWRRATAGRVLVDGVDLATVDHRWPATRTAYVGQSSHVFAASLADNLRLGRPDASTSEMVEACRRAELWEVVERLPSGLDTFVGERGSALSGGEAQRLAIARAFLADPPLLVLDEATSGLDLETEARVTRAMGRLMEGRTTIVIAHRSSTAAGCDLVVRLEGGRILEVR